MMSEERIAEALNDENIYPSDRNIALILDTLRNVDRIDDAIDIIFG